MLVSVEGCILNFDSTTIRNFFLIWNCSCLINLIAGNILRCAESALKLEERRQQIYKEVAMKNEELRLGSNTVSDYSNVIRL